MSAGGEQRDATRTIDDAMREFYARYLTAVRAISGELPLAEHDPEVPSECEVPPVDDAGMVHWRPVLREGAIDVSFLSTALGAPVRSEVVAWLGGWWTLPIEAEWLGAHVIVGGCSDAFTFARRIDGAVRHVAWCVSQGRALTVPVAVFTDDRFLAVDHATGAVVLEDPGRDARVVCANLVDFVDGLAPVAL